MKQKKKFTRPTVAIKHKKVLDKLSENGGSLANAIRETGLYSEEIALNPKKLTESKTWKEVLEKYFPDNVLAEKHTELLNSTRVDHLTFPLGPKKNKDKAEGEDSLSDEDIAELLAETNCKIRRVVRGETARHVYFWSSDNTAKTKALEMAYKIKGKYTDETAPKQQIGNVYNVTFSAPVQERIREVEAEIKNMLVKKNDQKTKENLGTE